MRKVILCLAMYVVTCVSGNNVAKATETVSSAESVLASYIQKLYNVIDFDKNHPLSFEIFNKAYRGYLNLKKADKLSNDKDILTVCDFTQSSNNDRMWIIDLKQRKVLYNTYVAHGAGTGEEFAQKFSNNFDSHQSSLGFYVTGDTYIGEHGNSLHLHGMDFGYNHNAYDRAIVVHGADYVNDRFIKGNERLGRSWGCPAVDTKLAQPIINTIKDGTCMFIYYPDKSYQKSAYWMNKKVDEVPQFVMDDLPLLLASKGKGGLAKKKPSGPPKIVYDKSLIPKDFYMVLPL
jgi:hypothetical protein